VKKCFNLPAIAIVIALIFLISCENEYPDSLWDPNYNSKPTPVIASIDPPDFTFSGISVITLNGQNFSPTLADNQVFFNGRPGTVQSASATQLQVKVPVLVADNITIAVRVAGAYLYGYFSPYRMINASVKYAKVDAFVNGFGLEVDNEERIYFLDGATRNIISIAHPDSDLVVYGAAGAPLLCTGMRFGPDGALYHLRNNRSLYSIPAGGGQRELFGNIFANNVADLDFAANGVLFAGGTGGNIFSVDITDKSVHTVADYTGYRISALRVYNGDLYVAAFWAGTGDPPSFSEGIWKHSIDSDTTLGPRQNVFDWKNFVGENGRAILTMTFDEDGILYVGSDKDVAITMVDLAAGTTEPLYPEILVPPITNMIWGPGQYIYVNRRSSDADDRGFLRIETTKFGAPYYGRP
jgi:hypothetical protein